MTSAPILLRMCNVSVDVAGLRALEVDSMEIPGTHGLCSIVLGQNGAGKSTLLNVVSGFAQAAGSASVEFVHPTKGVMNLRGLSRAGIVRAGIARTFQSPSVLSSLTVRQGIALAARLSARTSAGSGLWWGKRTGTGHIVETFELQTVQDTLHGELSHENLVRAELARCVATQPRLLLLDEPSAGAADSESQFLVRLLTETLGNMVRSLHADGRYRFADLSIALVTHDLTMVRELLKRPGVGQPVVHVLNLGRTVVSGAWADVSESEKARDVYFAKSNASTGH